MKILLDKEKIMNIENKDSIILPGEFCFFDFTSEYNELINEEIGLSNINKIKKNKEKYSQNLIFNSEEIFVNELKFLSKEKDIFLNCITSKNNGRNIDKLRCILNKIKNVKIMKSYELELNFNDINNKNNNNFFEQDFIYKKLYREFYDSNKKDFYSCLGPLKIQGISEYNNEIFNNNLKNYLNGIFKFINQHNAPLIIDLENYNKNDLKNLIEYINFGLKDKNKIYFINVKLNILKKNNFNKNDWFYNLSLDIEDFNLFKENNFNIFLFLSDFIRNDIDINIIINFIRNFNLDNIIVSCGLKYKIDFKYYSGKGFKILNKFYSLLNKDELLILNNNNLKFLKWFSEKEAKKEFKLPIKCSNCSELFDKFETKISKGDNEFCSLNCFRKFNK